MQLPHPHSLLISILHLSLLSFFTVGTASCWFLLDVVFYANGLFNHDVTSLVLSNGQPTTALQDAFNSAFICIVGINFVVQYSIFLCFPSFSYFSSALYSPNSFQSLIILTL